MTRWLDKSRVASTSWAYLNAAASRSGQRASDHGVTCLSSSTVKASAIAASPISSPSTIATVPSASAAPFATHSDGDMSASISG